MSSYGFTMVRVIDGDTFVANLDLFHPDLGLDWTIRNVHIRVFGVNTPERGKAGYANATSATETFLIEWEGAMWLECFGLDKYGRTLADVRAIDGSRLSSMLLHEGHAVPLGYRVSIPDSIAMGVPVWSQVRS